MVSMEAGRARYRDDAPRVPLSLGLTSVRLIVNKFETQCTRIPPEEKQIVRYDDFPLAQTRGQVFYDTLGLYFRRWIPNVTFLNFGVVAVTTGIFAPKMLSYLVVYPFCRLVFGTLYPAYASYKAVRTKNLKEYVKWMMYWIVFALFTCTETFTDVFLSWFPFYYEVKIVLVLWLLSPATKGSSILYRKFVHPALCRREQEIDEYIAKAKDQGYHTVLNLGTKGVNYATTVIMQTAIKGGGGLVQQIRKSYSLSDLTECAPIDEIDRAQDEADDVMTEPRLIRRVPKSGYSTRRSASESGANRSPMYFPEVDVDVTRPRPRSDEPDFSHIKSTEDISSGYSSADNSVSLTRTASLGARARSRNARTQLTAIKRPQAAEENEVIIEELQDDDFDYATMPSLVNVPNQIFVSQTEPPFLYQYVGDQVRIIQILNNIPAVSNTNNLEKNDFHRDGVLSNNKDEKTTETTINVCNEDTEPSNVEMNDTLLKQNISNLKQETDGATDNSIFDKINKCVVNTEPNIEGKKEVSNEEEKKYTSCNEKEISEHKLLGDTLSSSNTDQIINNIDNSIDDANSAESGDDEASFGTPENSPRTKRKLAKGKYGKGKAPPPPVENTPVTSIDNIDVADTTSQESILDVLNNMPNTVLQESGRPHKSRTLQVNPIAENKRRHKSKSPGKIPKSNSSKIGKLLQLPGKLAFWNKNDESNKSKSDGSEISDNSRRSSNIDQGVIDEFQSCADLSKIIPLETQADDQISFKDAFFESDADNIAQNIIDKSDALQKLIEAKIESHPEYKIVSLHAEISTTSKSTEV